MTTVNCGFMIQKTIGFPSLAPQMLKLRALLDRCQKPVWRIVINAGERVPFIPRKLWFSNDAAY
jgi:hypothetical protein